MIHRLGVLALVAYWASMFVGTHLPNPGLDRLSVSDKTLHFSGYFGLGLLLSWVLLKFRPSIAGMLTTMVIVGVYGMADELTQELVPSRTADAWDWAADVGGGMMGMSVYLAAVGLGCVASRMWHTWQDRRAGEAGCAGGPDVTILSDSA
ncbi:MAG: VanZ family protein [Pirellulaceae bacterium]